MSMYFAFDSWVQLSYYNLSTNFTQLYTPILCL
jgi:hypothetical protein